MGARELARYAVVFEPSDPPRAGRMAFFDPHGSPMPTDLGEAGVLTVAAPGQHGEHTTVPAVRLTVADAVPILTGARRAPAADPAAAFWGTAAVTALQLLARGRMLPGVSPGEHDAWRVGPLDPDDTDRIDRLAETMPATARAVPLPGTDNPPAAHGLLRGFLDAVADGMPRTAAAALAAGGPVFAATAPQRVGHLRDWSQEVAAGRDAGVRVSLRLEVLGGDYTRPFTAVVQVHSVADTTVVADAAALWAGDTRFGPRARIDVMVAVRRAARAWPPLEPLLHAAVPAACDLADDDLGELLTAGAAALGAAGVDVHWPRDLARELSARAIVDAEGAPPSDLPGFFRGDRALRVNWQLALGGQSLTAAELDELAQAHRPVVRLRDQWVLVDPDLARKARNRTLTATTPIEALSAALTGHTEVDGQHVEVSAASWLDDLRARLADLGERTPIEQPAALTAPLRDYQLHGLRWLAQLTELGLGGCLADDMGLGKTITLIALHLHRAAHRPTLVVCPASLLGNWEREIARFAPGTPTRRYHGPARTLEGADTGFVITTYGTMRLDAAALGAHGWDLVVADEAQHVKNPRSGTARALRQIPADARIALTGTPVENALSELWAILDWTTPGLLGTLPRFRSRWSTPIEADGDSATAHRLARLVRPFLLRRRKSDPGIAPELPPKTETDQPVALTLEQAGLYEAAVRELMAQVSGASGMARRGAIVTLLTALKQICNHPAQYLREPEGRLPGRSGKLELLDELVDTIVAEDGAVLVFTQYVTMARLLQRHLGERGHTTQLLHGGTPVARREDMVARFQSGDAPVFLLSLKAAGTGLNLTRADHVVHYDRWWNPAVEDQATDRAYRIGQTRPVQVHRLITEGTVEDRIAAMLAAKRDLADAVLDAGESALTELTDTELADLVALR